MELPEPSQNSSPPTVAATPIQQPVTAPSSDVEDIANWLKSKELAKDIANWLKKEEVDKDIVAELGHKLKGGCK